MKKIKSILKLLKNSNFSTKVLIYMSTKTASTDYDSYEKNWAYSNLNPLTIKAYVSDISSEALVWKQIGTKEIGAKSIICESKYADWFRKCNKIEIDGDTYQVYKDNVGNRVFIDKRPANLIRVIVSKA